MKKLKEKAIERLAGAAERAQTLVARYGLLLTTLIVVSGVAMAGTTGGDGAEFQEMYDLVRGWLTGTLGKLFAVGAFGVGMGVGIVKQSLMAIAIGLGFALALAYAPAIIEKVFTFAI